MLKNDLLAKSVRFALIGGAATAALSVAPVFAADESEEKVERISVTGSRIQRADVETAQPVLSVEREDLLASGLTSVGDYINQLTIGAAAINTQSNNGGDGSTRLSLRNLGSGRVLVLVNGRRWVGDGGSVDLNTIPSTIIKRIDILKDGAAAVYGSDAIAGVVNIITRDDFEGVELTAYTGGSSRGDGEQDQFDVSIGQTGEKGSVYFNASYVKTQPIWAGDRRLSREPVFGTGNTQGSSGTPSGRFTFVDADGNYNNLALNSDYKYNGTNPVAPTYDADGNITNPDANDYHSFTNEDRYNYAPVNYLLTPQERWSAFVQGKYELTDDIQLSSEVLFNHRESSQLLAPAPLFIGPWAGGAESLSPTVVSSENIYNPFGQDIFGSDENGDAATVGFIGRRMLEGGGRQFRQTKDTWRFGLSVDGGFEFLDQDWGWNVGYSFAENAGTEYAEGKYVTTRISHALSAECNSDPSCVPLNLFGGEGAITQEQLDYISYNEHNTNGDTLINYSANVNGALFELPAGPLSIAFGWEYRREKGFDSPDYIVTSGQTSGNDRQATEGSFSEYAYYAEFNVPVLADMPGVESLEFDLAIRKTELENSEGLKSDNTSGKVAMAYKPFSDMLVRASWSQGFRAPTIFNLFGGLGTSFPTVTDPCNDGGGALPGCVNVPDSYSQPNSQIQGQVGSNSNLIPETSESISAGIVYSPSALEGFDVAIDYWDIQIDDLITRAGHQQVLDTCSGVSGETNHPVAEFCGDILQRAPGGTPVLFANPYLNLGSLNTSGFDLTMNYSFETNVGDFRISWDNTYTDNYSLTNNAGVESVFTGELGLPRLKSNLTLSWAMDDLTASWKTRFISDQRDDCRSAYAAFDLCNATETDADGDVTNFRDIGDYYVHDLQVNYHLSSLNSRVTLGVNNIFDEEPPLAPNQTNSFDGDQYDGTGRYFYGRLTVNF